MHGGDNGELNHHFNLPEIEYIFDKTFEELREFDMGQGERIPTLRDVIALIDKRMLINIEVKTPFSAEVKLCYDY